MVSKTVARPYSLALFKYAKKQKVLEKWSVIISLLTEAMKNEMFKKRMLSPRLSDQQKMTDFSFVLKNDMNDEVKNFLSLLLRNKRLALLPEIKEQFIRAKEESENVQQVVVYSSYSLSKEQIAKLSKKMNHILNKKIEITVKIDSSLIAGVKICVENWVYDDTVKSRIEKLARAIVF